MGPSKMVFVDLSIRKLTRVGRFGPGSANTDESKASTATSVRVHLQLTSVFMYYHVRSQEPNYCGLRL